MCFLQFNILKNFQAVSEQMQLEGHKPGPEDCQRKWGNLASKFHQQKAEAEAKGSVPLWPYYTRVRNLVTQIGIPEPSKLKLLSIKSFILLY